MSPQRGGSAIAGELTELLVELSVAVQRRVMYPGGHPSLVAGERRLIQHLTTLLAQRQLLVIGVAREQLIIDGIATEVRQPLLRALAERLHAHHIAGVKFIDGVTATEATELVARIARDPRDIAEQREAPSVTAISSQWVHIQLFRQAYERLTLSEEEGTEATGVHGMPRATQLWLDLAQAAMSAGDTPGDVDTDPAAMARAIDARTTGAGGGASGSGSGTRGDARAGASDSAYEQVVIGHLMQIADEIRTTQSPETAALRERVSRLVTTLSPQAMQRLLSMGGNLAQRRAFLVDATAGMAVDAVLTLTLAASTASQRAISQPLTRLLVKLASHAQHGAPPLRSAADPAFRDHVRDLVEGWTLPDPTPGGYGDVLDSMSRPTEMGPITSGITQRCEPERVLEMCLDLRNASPPLWEAIAALITRGDIILVLDTLDAVPPENPLPGVIRTRIATLEHFRRLLQAPTADVRRIEDFARRVGTPATEALLDALGEASTRTARRRLLDVLGHLGEAIGPAVVARLPNATWYVQRNLLMIVAGLPVWPPGFSPLPYASHTDARVRREALRALLKHPALRTVGIMTAIADVDPQLVRLGLDAAARECPPAVVPRLVQRIDARSLSPELQSLAVQVLATSPTSAALHCLLGLATRRTRWLRRERIAHRSPVVLAALTGLATQWAHEPNAARVLAKAAGSSDREIRGATASQSVALAPTAGALDAHDEPTTGTDGATA